MHYHHSSLLIRAASIIFLAALSISALATTGGKVELIADGVGLFRHGEHRSLFLYSNDGVIVTDPINRKVAVDYRAAIAAITDKPVTHVVYSHYHWDRIAGAEVFAEEGATIIAQQRCAQRFLDNPNPAIATPDITFEDRYTVTNGEQTLELYYFGPSHGDCLTVFVVPDAGLIQLVDLVNPPGASFPKDPRVPYVRPHNLRQFFEAVNALIAEQGISQVAASRVDDTLTAEGAVEASLPVAEADIVGQQAQFWYDVYGAVETARAEGRVGIDSMVRLKKDEAAAFEKYANYNKDDLPLIMRRFTGFYDMGR